METVRCSVIDVAACSEAGLLHTEVSQSAVEAKRREAGIGGIVVPSRGDDGGGVIVRGVCCLSSQSV